jgi:hypothetical protein
MGKSLKNWRSIVLFLGMALFLLILAVAKVVYEKVPEGKSGERADELAVEILETLGYSSWREVQYVQWTFMKRNHYRWDKKNDWIEVRWGSNKVLMNTQNLEGFAWKDSERQEGDKKKKMLEKAWSNFCNDSFWLIAPFKLFDEGVERKIVIWEDQEALLVTYNEGGTTPGDSYLWLLGEDKMPVAWKMWVSIIPVKGLKATWGNWEDTGFGSVSRVKKIGIVPVSVTDLVLTQDLSKICLQRNCFELLEPSGI